MISTFYSVKTLLSPIIAHFSALSSLGNRKNGKKIFKKVPFMGVLTLDILCVVCYYKYIVLIVSNEAYGTIQQRTRQMNKYQIDTLLWSTTENDVGDQYESITFEVWADSEQDAWAVAGDYMNDNYNQELYNADTTITEVQ